MREPSRLDCLVTRVDAVLRAAARTGLRQRRASPAIACSDPPMAARERRHAAGLMRVNHAGEISAQALYVGQALLARRPETHARLLDAAREEGDHLWWCEARLAELGSRPSVLNPLWFGGSLLIGMCAAAVGDRWSLGFVEETERQVVEHLEGHLAALPGHDLRSRAIVTAMRDDEARHAAAAGRSGARALPGPVRRWMRANARVMTTLAYRL